jgi:hypothetical protein
MGVDFDYKLFNCMEFYGFICNYCENITDVECKKNTFYVYPKNYRFGPPGKFLFIIYIYLHNYYEYK